MPKSSKSEIRRNSEMRVVPTYLEEFGYESFGNVLKMRTTSKLYSWQVSIEVS